MATTDDAIDWEGIAREQLERTAIQTADDLETALRTLGVQIGSGTAEPSDIKEARTAIQDAIYLLEETLAAAVTGAEIGAGDSRYIRNNGGAAEYFELTMAQVGDAVDGGVVDLDDDAITALAKGDSILTSTTGGIDVTIEPVTAAAEVNPGP